jgi:isopentenyldiphosphate isomerase
MEEYLDILDEHGAETGESLPRSEVHAKGLWHRTVHIFVYRKVGTGIELLVHLRSETKDLKPNLWAGSFGGHVQAGESLEDALQDELKDETGIDIDPQNLFRWLTRKGGTYPNQEFVTTYFYDFNGDITKLEFNKDEVQEIKWMSTREILLSMEENPDKWASSSKSISEIESEIKKI